MNWPRTYPLLGGLLLVTTTAALAAPTPACHDRTTLAALIAAPQVFHGKAVSITAYVTIEFENMKACPSENETEIGRCLWLKIDDGPYKSDADYARYELKLQTWQPLSRQIVTLDASFDRNERGHFSMWPGGLVKVTRVAGRGGVWNFGAKPAAPNAACQ